MNEEYVWLLEVALTLLAAKALEALFVRAGFARILAYLLIGVILSAIYGHFELELSDVYEALALIGIVVLLFQAGLESSLRQFLRSLRDASIIAIGGVAASIIMGILLMPAIGIEFKEALAMGIIFVATSISVTVKVLEELGVLTSPEAQAIIGAAVVDDVIGLALLSILHALPHNAFNIVQILVVPLLAFGLWFGTAIISNALIGRLFRTVLKMQLEAGIEAVSFALVLLLAFLAQMVGLSMILLAYAFGLGIASFRYAAKRVEERLRILTSLFAPLFFIYVGSRLDIELLMSYEIWELISVIGIVVLFGFLSKIVGCYLAARILGFSSFQSIVIGIGMVPRAEVALVAATMSLEMKLISHNLFVSVLVLVTVSLFIVPILIPFIYRHARRM
ncbi:MAG TPA: cation:proton antiporter [Ignisphaera aggregans]|uniref:Cation:proton antiporter n=1 Tax=Ignisphaera aggregans TaxID=334771 RepID=A0A832YZL3_9CREN|nr:cation:proton antiporter [Ignisphaera aggregans]